MRKLIMQESKAVYYAITADTFFYNQVLISIKSLRKFNNTIPVYLFIFGKTSEKSLKKVRRFNVNTIKQPEIGKLYPYMVKWLALDKMPHKQILFLDADTILFDNVEYLFNKFKTYDFYARQEIGTITKPYKMGKYNIKPQIKHFQLNEIFKSVRGKKTPIFNAGVMLFNNHSNRKIKSNKFLICFKKLLRGDWPYPSINSHIRGEIALAIYLSQVKDFQWRFFTKEFVPYYYEVEKLKNKPKRGLILHVTTAQYSNFLNSRLYKKLNI